MSIEAYKIGITLSLTNKVSSALGLIARDFRSTNASAEKLKSTLKDIKLLGLAGGALLGAGVLGLSALKAPLEEAKLYQTEMERFKALGYGDAVASQADKFARGLDIMGASSRDNLTMLREVTGIMGDFEHAKEALPMLAKMKFGLESVMGAGEGGKFEQMFQAAIKVSELRGALVDRATGKIDVEKFGNALNQMTQAYVASGGLVKPTDYLAAIKTGGVSTKMMSDEMFYFGLGHFMQESGGSRTGTAAMSMFQNLAMGRMSQQVAEQLQKYGLLDASKIHYGKTGHITKVDPMGVVNAQQFIENPFKWMNETAVAHLKAMGLQGNDINMGIARMLGIRTAQNLADQMVREQTLAETYIGRAHRAANSDKLYTAGAGTMTGKEIELHAKWNKLMLELGSTILPMAVWGLTKLVSAVKGITAWAQAHPALTKGLMLAFAGLSGAAAVGGSLLLLVAGIKGLGLLIPSLGLLTRAIGLATGLPGMLMRIGSGLMIAGRVLIGALGAAGPFGWIILGLTALVVGGVYVYNHWATIKPKLLGIWDGITGWFSGLYDAAIKGLGSMWGAIKKGLTPDLGRLGPALGLKAAQTSDEKLASINAQLRALGAPEHKEQVADGTGFAAMIAQRRGSKQGLGLGADVNAGNAPGAISNVAAAGMAKMVADAVSSAIGGLKVQMDGRTVGQIVMDGMTRDASKPTSGVSGYDFRLGPTYPAGGF